MPSLHKISARTERRCAPCQHHKITASFHARSGEGSYREYACMHPKAQLHALGLAGSDEQKQNVIYRLSEWIKLEGRPIGRTELQPGWCPLLKCRWRSCAEWAPEVYTSFTGSHISDDTHANQESAQGACDLLQQNGFGGNHQHYLLRTWTEPIEEVEPKPQ